MPLRGGSPEAGRIKGIFTHYTVSGCSKIFRKDEDAYPFQPPFPPETAYSGLKPENTTLHHWYRTIQTGTRAIKIPAATLLAPSHTGISQLLAVPVPGVISPSRRSACDPSHARCSRIQIHSMFRQPELGNDHPSLGSFIIAIPGAGRLTMNVI